MSRNIAMTHLAFVPAIPFSSRPRRRLRPAATPVPGRPWRCANRGKRILLASAVSPFEDRAAALQRKYGALQKRISINTESVDLQHHQSAVSDLQAQSAAPDFWDDSTSAQASLRELASHERIVSRVTDWSSLSEEAFEFIELGAEGDEYAMLDEAERILINLGSDLDAFELERLLDGPHDAAAAIITITAGAGGTDAQDWAAMLSRMYIRWAQSAGYSVSTLDMSEGEEAGYKSITLQITGEYVCGYMGVEKGTHRLVRQSPFNAQSKRQTSFAGVEVMPVLEERQLSSLEIPESELSVSFSRAGGKGGQNVNKVETAVRLTHVPTGLTVRCAQERSQMMNRTRALEMLKAKVLVVLEEQRVRELSEIRGDMVEAAWGMQIRNYVLHPYKMVKDVRTGFEDSDAAAVLDGRLDGFIQAGLRWRREARVEAELAAKQD